MAESKNTFIKSKMNRDLDERLIPNGEYREAVNISVSQSEGSDVGTLQNVLGNVLVTDFGLTDDCNVKIIGTFVDDQNKEIYVFLTNFIDTSVDTISSYPPDNAICQIWKRNIETNQNTKLVEGKFLNFSLTHHIEGINLLEDLLFWTDNRNQPRKINVNKANPESSNSPTYYTNDDQINVAKYYPHNPISLIKNYIVDFEITDDGNPSDYNDYIGQIVPCTGGSGEGLLVRIIDAGSVNGELKAIEIVSPGNGYEDGDVVDVFTRIGTATLTLTVESATTMKDTCSEYLPIYAIFPADSPPDTLTSGTPFDIAAPTTGLDLTAIDYTGALVKVNSNTDDSPYLARVTAQNAGATPKKLTIEWPNLPNTVANVTSIEVGINPDYQANWPGDCQYLKNKFVRFGYRFKYDDNEYSLISPFTQACFIPKQDGYFLEETKQLSSSTEDVLDTTQAYENTDNLVMTNKVTNVELLIPCPEFLGNTPSTFNNLESQMHVESIEIIYKDDAEQVLRVLDTLELKDFTNLNSNILSYNYQSRSPKRPLPENEATRISDRVPIRALAQEVTGNRVMYGNFVDGYTSVNLLNYEVGASEKSSLSGGSTIKKEYQNHTLKQDRSYQVGIVLCDRYGRNSDVILSSVDLDSTLQSAVTYSGSTIFHPFYSVGFSSNELISDVNTTWPGDILKIKFNSQIPENIGKVGYPGLFIGYEAPSISNLFPGSGYNQADGTNQDTSGGSGSGLTVDFTTFKPTLSYITSVTINDPGTGYEPGDVITIDRPLGVAGDATFIYNPGQIPNLTGWYSYKIVVKQTEQDYYNVYLPGIINGAINKEGIESATEATISLYGDNINKVPKDLTNVGPSQTIYNSTEKLTVRVVNTNDFASTQYYPGEEEEKVTQISELSNLGISLLRYQDEVSAGPAPGTTFNLENFFEGKIFPGMSVTSVNNAGTTKLTTADGVYVKAYFPTATGSTVIFNKSLTVPGDIAQNDLLTFGPPGVVFNSSNNPLIGILSTSKKIGIPEEDDFKTQLAVTETKPFESLLDIYYETTSSGLITNLNTLVAEGLDPTSPARISPIAISFNESQTGNAVISNTFNLLDNANADILEPTVTGTLVSVTDKTFPIPNNRSSEFTLNDDGNGSFTIATNKNVGEGFYVGANPQIDTFSFTVELIYDGVNIFKTIDGKLENIRPVYQGAYDGTSYNIDKTQPANIPTETTAFECVNGSGDSLLEQEEIQWTLVSAIATDGSNASPPSGFPTSQVNWPTGFIVPQAGQNPNTIQAQSYQIVKGRDYKELFTMQRLAPGTGVSTNVLNGHDLQFRFAGLNSINGGDSSYSYTYQAVVGYEPSPFTSWIGGGTAIYEEATGVATTTSLIDEVTFTLTFEAKDASGAANSLSASLISITVIAS